MNNYLKPQAALQGSLHKIYCMARNKRIKSICMMPIELYNMIIKEFNNPIQLNKVIILLDRIIHTFYLNKRISLDDYIPIPSTYISKVLTKRYVCLWRGLQNIGVIERTGQPSQKLHLTYRYRICPAYLQKEWQLIEYYRELKSNEVMNFKYKYVYRCLNKLSIPYPIDEMVCGRLINIQDSILKKHQDEKTIDQMINIQLYREKLELQKIKDKLFRVSRNGTNHRLDTSITNMSGVYIKQMKLDNEPMISFDLQTSQFTILANLLLNYYFDDVSYIELCDYVDSLYTTIPTLYPCKKWYHNDISEFCCYAINGELYDSIASLAGMNNRSQGKKACFQLVFGLYGNKKTQLQNEFHKHFPAVSLILENYKARQVELERQKYHKDSTSYRKMHKGKTYKQVGSNKLPILLQRLESAIFIDNIYYELAKNNIIALTVHDSIMVSKSSYDRAYDIIVKQLNKWLPFGYSVRIEDHETGTTNTISSNYSRIAS